MIRKPFHGRTRRVSRETKVRTFADPVALQAAWRKYKDTADGIIRNRLVEHYLFLVRFAAERIGAKLPDEVDVDDLMSAGIFGLVDAIDAFDLSRGVKFETYCALRIRGAILDELRSMDWVPRLVRHRAHKLEETLRALEVELGRAPNDDELCSRMGLSRPDFDKLRKDANAVSVVSMSQAFNDSDTNRENAEFDGICDERSRDPIAEAQKSDLREILSRDLTKAEKLIIVLYYFEQMTMKEIGVTLDLSESRVSQMHSALIDRMRGQLGLSPAGALTSMDMMA